MVGMIEDSGCIYRYILGFGPSSRCKSDVMCNVYALWHRQ